MKLTLEPRIRIPERCNKNQAHLTFDSNKTQLGKSIYKLKITSMALLKVGNPTQVFSLTLMGKIHLKIKLVTYLDKINITNNEQAARL